MYWKDLFFSLVYLFIALWVIRRTVFFRLNTVPSWWVYGAFILKVLGSLILAAIFTFYYSDTFNNDIYRLYHDSNVLYDLRKDNFIAFIRIMSGAGAGREEYAGILDSMNNWYSQGSVFTGNNRFIIRMHVLFSLLSGGSFFARFIINNFLVLGGLVLLFRYLSAEAGIRQRELFAAVFLFPSVVLWSSAVFKEGFILIGLAMALWGSRNLINGNKIIKGLGFISGGIMLLFLTRPYFILLLLMFLPVYHFRKESTEYVFLKYLITTVLAAGFFSVLAFSGGRFNIFDKLAEKQSSFIQHAKTEQAGSVIYLPEPDGTFSGFLKTAGAGLYNSFLRPMFLDVRKLTAFPASLENLFVLFMLLMIPFYYRKQNDQRNLVWFCLFMILANHLIIGMTVPVAGAIVRYKVTTMPFLLTFLILTLNNRTPFLRLFRSSP